MASAWSLLAMPVVVRSHPLVSDSSWISQTLSRGGGGNHRKTGCLGEEEELSAGCMYGGLSCLYDWKVPGEQSV